MIQNRETSAAAMSIARRDGSRDSVRASWCSTASVLNTSYPKSGRMQVQA